MTRKAKPAAAQSGWVGSKIRSAAQPATSPRAHVGTSPRALVKVTLNLPEDVITALKTWALADRTTVGALVEALAAAAEHDDTLRTATSRTARDIADGRRARK